MRFLVTGFLLVWGQAALADQYTIPLLVSAPTTGAPQGVLRILNGTDEPGTVEIYAIDDAGTGKWRLTVSSDQRFTETAEIDGVSTTYMGSYDYAAIGPDAGRMTLTYGDGDECAANLYFSTHTAGWFASHCTGSEYPADGTRLGGSWSVEDDEDDGSEVTGTTPAGSLGECYVSLSVSIGQSCTYPGTTDATITTGDTEVGTDAVSALAPSSASDQSISLTASSNAGTYYYGACINPVSGESDTGNNCSSAVLVTVTDSQMETETFDLDPNNGDPSGIAFANNSFYVVDYTDDKVYVRNSTASPDFDLFVSFADLHYSLISSPGDPIEMSVTVANLGPHGSPPARLRFGSSTYRDIPALDPPANGIVRGTGSRVRVGTVRVGTLTFRACIVEAPGEENTSNNCVSRSVTFR